ncbi:MAG: DUF1553 domain-containing protein [Verrucomicrobiaceae bacterium]|nr:DUF1553 domain-containing protein [Verrucomicrobiaceae bacterium]
MVLAIIATLTLAIPSATIAAPVGFNEDIRPILSNSCYRCHGPDEAERKAELRLDTRDGATKDLGGYAAIVPGNPNKSTILARISSHDLDEVMPPAKASKPLETAEIELIKRWIKDGAPYAKHWAYVPREKISPPKIDDASHDHGIDRFISARLQKEGLTLSEEADRHHLARRVALDLTGLPPSAEEVNAFVQSDDPTAYETLVDGLLDKKAYGEHWARHWLDLARYADSAGYADDPARTIWAYRDYVIRSFNQNKPFDVFTREQLAGDLLPNPTQDQLIATAFHRNTQTNNEGGTSDEEFRNVAVVDRVSTTFSVWMGTTMGCAQGHTHKYDPITHEEYFQVFALFNNTADADRRDESPLVNVETEDFKFKKKSMQQDLQTQEEAFYQVDSETQEAFTAWQSQQLMPNKSWQPLANIRSNEQSRSEQIIVPCHTKTTDKVTALRLEIQPEGKNVVLNEIELHPTGPKPEIPNGQFVRIQLKGRDKILQLAEVEAFSLGNNVALSGKASQSSNFADAVAGRAIDGNTDGDYYKHSVSHTGTNDTDPWWQVNLGSAVPLDKLTVWNRTDGTGDRIKGAEVQILDAEKKVLWSQVLEEAPKRVDFDLDWHQKITLKSPSATFSQKDFGIAKAIDGDTKIKSGWAIAPQLDRSHAAVFHLAQPVTLPSLRVTLHQNYPGHRIENFRLSFTTESPPPQELPHSLRVILEKSERDESEYRQLFDTFALSQPQLVKNQTAIRDLRRKIAEMKPPTTVPVMRELAGDKRREPHIHLRGNYRSHGKQVTPGLPTDLHPSTVENPDRLALAEWIVDPKNPLTARVTVNRYWEAIFGYGLVRTSEEFGSQGERPSHPHLLDWLANRFIESGWDSKALLKDLVTSVTYRQSSKVTPEQLERDPDNRLLARGPRFRLSAEMVRDQALQVSGLLSKKMHGPPVNPRQPKIGLSAAFGGGIDWKVSEGEDQYRRGLYTTWRRSNPYPSMATFDAPNREVCVVRRDRTNTPLQALVTLNDPVFMEAAQSLARKLAAKDLSPEDTVDQAIWKCLSRPSKDSERQSLANLYNKTYERLKQEPDRALPLATDPIGPAPEGSDLVALASWAVVSNVILNLDEIFLKP